MPTQSKKAALFPKQTPPSLLPMPLTPLIGREREVAEICALLHDPHVRLLTLVGMGGVG